MMKNLLLTLFTALIFSASFGQITVTSPSQVAGDTVIASHINVTAYFTNTGTTNIPAGDTLFFALLLDGTLVSYGGTAGSVNYEVLAYDLAPGQRIEKSTNLGFLGVTTQTYTSICTIGKIGVSNFMTASTHCYVAERSFTSLEEEKLTEKTKVFAANNIINMSSTSNENLSYNVISLTGQVMSQGNFVNNKQIDLSNAAKGIYMVMITNGTEKITKKVVIQ